MAAEKAAPDATRTGRDRSHESGQAIVEFALILFPLLLLVAGIIYFGIGLNYWLDMQRIANQGARFASVNCGQTATSPVTPNPCGTPVSDTSLQTTLKDEALTSGLNSAVTVVVCYPSGTGQVGEPVKVKLEAPFTFPGIVPLGTITLRASATMRVEVPRTPTAGYNPTNPAPATC